MIVEKTLKTTYNFYQKDIDKKIRGIKQKDKSKSLQ